MTPKRLAATFVAMLALNLAGISQTPSELLQKGIHTQEAVGDLDGAIAIFRQVVTAASTNKPLAAQAQYQLVLCMLQKGDRAGAQNELAALERNFGEMTDLVAKARKLIPGSTQMLPEPWGDDECEQLNIKRNGVATGEYLYYSVQTWGTTLSPSNFAQYVKNNPNDPRLQAWILHWELKTTKSTHGITITVDRNTHQPLKYTNSHEAPSYDSDDDFGIDSIAPFAGPAIDVEESVFLLRQLPLAVGYQTTIPVTSNAIAPSQLKLIVTGIESIQTPAGKFNCYKVSFASIGQIFWIGAEGKRPLVKFQSEGVEAELVKVWGPESPLEAVRDILRKGGFGADDISNRSGGRSSLSASPFIFKYLKRYLAKPDLADELQQLPTQRAKEMSSNDNEPIDYYKVRLASAQKRIINGQQAISCLMDYVDGLHDLRTKYVVWILTENGLLEIWTDLKRSNVGTFRWRLDPILAAIHLP